MTVLTAENFDYVLESDNDSPPAIKCIHLESKHKTLVASGIMEQ